MVLPTNQISFLDLRRVIGPNNTAPISLGQCRPSFPPAYGNGLTGVTDTDIKMSQFQGKSKLYKSGLSFRAFKDSAYTFTLGTGGAGGTASPYYYPYGFDIYSHGGGGGGGGILVNGGGGDASGGGGSWNANTGNGGTGYGAGGGSGAQSSTPAYGGRDVAWPGSGKGSRGFAYLALNNSEFFTDTNTSYLCSSSGTLQFIIVGAGADGPLRTMNGIPAGASRNGGNSGSLNYGSIAVTSGTSITITVGYSNGASTSIVVNGTTYSAAGGNAAAGTSGGIASGGATGAVAINGAPGTAGGNAGTGTQSLSYLNTARTSISIVGAYFADNISLFNTYIAHATGITTNMTNLTSATNSIYTTGGSSINFSIEWVGQFYPPTTGSYTFYLNSDDASYLWIGSNASSGYTTANANINNGGSHGMVNVSYTVALTGGTLYPMRIQYGQGGGSYDLQFSFEGPSIARTYNMDGYVYN